MKIGAGGLVIGNLVGLFTTSLILLVKLSKSGRITNLFQDKENILIQAKRYSDFLKINTIHAFSDVLQAMLLVFFLTSYFGIAAVGFFAFTSRIIKTPVSMVAGSVTQVFFQDTSEKYANGLPIQSMVVKMVRNLALWSAPAFAVLMLFGPWLFALVFGEDWRQAGKYAQIMAPWMYINFVVVPISQIPVVVHQQLSNFLISLFGHILVIGAVIYGGYTGESIESTLTFISASQTIFLIVVIFWIIKISGKVKE
jgi:O-antigen/teichoic acid export membrane protein